ALLAPPRVPLTILVLVGYYLSSLCLLLVVLVFFSLMLPPPPRSTLFPYTTLFRSDSCKNIVAFSPEPKPKGSVVSISAQTPLARSEEHTSELQSRFDLVCRLLLEKKKDTSGTLACLRRVRINRRDGVGQPIDSAAE